MAMVKCPHCGGEINPASLLGLGKNKTMSAVAVKARQEASKKPRPNALGKKKPRKPKLEDS